MDTAPNQTDMEAPTLVHSLKPPKDLERFHPVETLKHSVTAALPADLMDRLLGLEITLLEVQTVSALRSQQQQQQQKKKKKQTSGVSLGSKPTDRERPSAPDTGKETPTQVEANRFRTTEGRWFPLDWTVTVEVPMDPLVMDNTDTAAPSSSVTEITETQRANTSVELRADQQRPYQPPTLDSDGRAAGEYVKETPTQALAIDGAQTLSDRYETQGAAAQVAEQDDDLQPRQIHIQQQLKLHFHPQGESVSVATSTHMNLKLHKTTPA
ncbi:unnamed protein product [Lampetra planeri]